jgi:U3 small nucleolar RNA-associated protein 25
VLGLEMLQMQNWEHLLTACEAMNQTPSSDHGTDFSRVRPFCLNGWGRSWRQTIVLGPYATPDANGLFREECRSLQGRAVSRTPPHCTPSLLPCILMAAFTTRAFSASLRSTALNAALHVAAS